MGQECAVVGERQGDVVRRGGFDQFAGGGIVGVSGRAVWRGQLAQAARAVVGEINRQRVGPGDFGQFFVCVVLISCAVGSRTNIGRGVFLLLIHAIVAEQMRRLARRGQRSQIAVLVVSEVYRAAVGQGLLGYPSGQIIGEAARASVSIGDAGKIALWVVGEVDEPLVRARALANLG